jgi:tetratricopeptide (TPR) repeat protein
MSLLMEALKKAERAKQNSLAESGADKPSQEFDQVLALTPEPAAQATPAAGRELSLDLEPMAAFSLEPLVHEPVAASMAPRPSPSPLPAPSDHGDAGLTLDLTPDPSAPAATPHGVQPGVGPRMGSDPAVPGSKGGVNENSASATFASAASSASAGKPRGAARARAAATITPEPAGMEPERVRLIGLLTVLGLIIVGFGFYYWQAIAAPGAGSRLPPVPMPPPGATGATPVQVIAAGAPSAVNGLGATNSPPANALGGADGQADSAMLAPPSSRGRDDIERRLARAEQELAATQQAMQAQLNSPSPRVEKLPPVVAPDNSEIRVARAVQTSKLSPVLDGAYQAMNKGDLPSAQRQYENALRQDANNRDALLGLATLAARQNQGPQAAAYYQRLLELDPTDATAAAGLIGLRQGDAGLSENRLKAILGANPESAPALFALGNLYAQQGRWQDAQQNYFRAYSAAPDNPDYAYNLAIGLDRLNQPKLALTYYQRALTLAQDKPAAFDREVPRKRVLELNSAR